MTGNGRPSRRKRSPDRASPDRAERRKLYKSARWRKFRAQFLRANPRCVYCGGAANVVDHVLGHGKDWRERFWTGPFAASCGPCNSRKAMTGDEAKRNPETLRARQNYDALMAGILPGGYAVRTRNRTKKSARDRAVARLRGERKTGDDDED